MKVKAKDHGICGEISFSTNIKSIYDSANAVEKSEHWRVAGELLVIRKVIQRLPGYRFHH